MVFYNTLLWFFFYTNTNPKKTAKNPPLGGPGGLGFSLKSLCTGKKATSWTTVPPPRGFQGSPDWSKNFLSFCADAEMVFLTRFDTNFVPQNSTRIPKDRHFGRFGAKLSGVIECQREKIHWLGLLADPLPRGGVCWN